MGRDKDADAMTIWDIFAAGLAGILGAMGLGGGSVLVLYLTFFRELPQTEAQGINLLFFIPCAVWALIVYRKRRLIDFTAVLPIVLGGLIGVTVGNALLPILGGELLRKIFGVLLLFIGSSEIYAALKNRDKSS